MKNRNARVWVVVAAFLLAVIWFFILVGRPEGDSLPFAMRLALPAALLAFGGLGLLPRLMSAAFFFCAVGDAMGVMGSFEGQMAGFAIAHICFICWFAKCIGQSRPKRTVITAITLLCFIPLFLAAWKVIPAIRNLPIRIGCIVYALLLVGTVWTSAVSAFSAQKGRRFLLYVAALGGLLFLVSDFILSWNKFTEHIPHASLYIMSTYYAALLFLFVGTLRGAIQK